MEITGKTNVSNLKSYKKSFLCLQNCAGFDQSIAEFDKSSKKKKKVKH